MCAWIWVGSNVNVCVMVFISLCIAHLYAIRSVTRNERYTPHIEYICYSRRIGLYEEKLFWYAINDGMNKRLRYGHYALRIFQTNSCFCSHLFLAIDLGNDWDGPLQESINVKFGWKIFFSVLFLHCRHTTDTWKWSKLVLFSLMHFHNWHQTQQNHRIHFNINCRSPQ